MTGNGSPLPQCFIAFNNINRHTQTLNLHDYRGGERGNYRGGEGGNYRGGEGEKNIECTPKIPKYNEMGKC